MRPVAALRRVCLPLASAGNFGKGHERVSFSTGSREPLDDFEALSMAAI